MAKDTPKNRALLEGVANNPINRLGSDKYGSIWYAKTQADGSQVWVKVRGDFIVDGGVNDSPLPYNPETGLCSPTKP